MSYPDIYSEPLAPPRGAHIRRGVGEVAAVAATSPTPHKTVCEAPQALRNRRRDLNRYVLRSLNENVLL